MADLDRFIASEWIFNCRIPRALPAFLFGVRLWASVCLALFIAFKLELENGYWAATTAAIVCQPAVGASLRKGWFRLLGTLAGAVAAIVLSAYLPQDRAAFLFGLALWGGICAFAATVLPNFASYGAALAGFTAAVIVGDELGAVGGPDATAFTFAAVRATEIGIGIVCAGLVLATTSFGNARWRLAVSISSLAREIAGGLVGSLQLVGSAQADSRVVRWRLIGQIGGLDKMIDDAAGEVGAFAFHPRAMQVATDRLLVALISWRSVANHLELAPSDCGEAAQVIDCLPSALTHVADWRGDLRAPRDAMWGAARRLTALPSDTPTLRLLCDRTAEGLLALRHAIAGAMRLEDPRSARLWRRSSQFRIADILPALINGTRAFLTIGAAELIWVWTAWPSGATFIVYAAVGVTVFAPQEDAAYDNAKSFTVGTALAIGCAAAVAFAILPQLQSFTGLCLAIGLVVIPAGLLSSQPWHQPVFVALSGMFVAVLHPANPQIYDTAQFYDSASATLGGMGLAMLAIRLLPPMSPTARAYRLLALTLRDLRQLTRTKLPKSSAAWEGRIFARLSVLPTSVDLIQAVRMSSALSVGAAIIRLRRVAHRFGLDTQLEPAMAAIARGDCSAAIRALDRFDLALAEFPTDGPGGRVRLRTRGTIRTMIGSLARHAGYFDSKAKA